MSAASDPAAAGALGGAAAGPATGTDAVLVIGYGSPIRGDDAIGPLAADALASAPLPAGVRVLSRHVLTAELAEDLARARRVVFIDAAAEGAPGEIRVRELRADASAPSTMAHFLDPRELLAWCECLYGHAPQTWLVTAAGQTFDYAGYHLSPAARGALPGLIERVRGLLAPGAEGDGGPLPG